MGFNKDKAIIAQNSATVAASVTAAIIMANPEHATTTESALHLFDHVREHIFTGSLRLAGAEAVVTHLESGEAVVSDDVPANSGGGGRGGGGKAPGDVTFNVGKHKGKTIAQVHEEAPDYLTWCVENMKNDFMVSRIKAYLGQ